MARFTRMAAHPSRLGEVALLKAPIFQDRSTGTAVYTNSGVTLGNDNLGRANSSYVFNGSARLYRVLIGALTISTPNFFRFRLKTGADVTTLQRLLNYRITANNRNAISISGGKLTSHTFNGTTQDGKSIDVAANTFYDIGIANLSHTSKEIYINNVEASYVSNPAITNAGLNAFVVGGDLTDSNSLPLLGGSLDLLQARTRIIPEAFRTKNYNYWRTH